MWMVALLALAGCAQTVWTKPGATATDFERVKAVCDYQSEMGTPNENIGYGTSGAIASGISEGIRKGTLMQKCMIADGWHPEQAPTGAALAAAQSKRAQIKAIADQRSVCIAEIRNRPENTPLQPHFSEIGTGKLTMMQLTDERVPTPGESRLVVAYQDEASSCINKSIDAAVKVLPALGPIMQQQQASNDATMILLIQRKLTWGEQAQRTKQLIEETREKIQAIRL
jgi:hypothetical protein